MPLPTGRCEIGTSGPSNSEAKVPHLEELDKVDADGSNPSMVVVEHELALSDRSTRLSGEIALSDKASSRSDSLPRHVAEAVTEAAVRRPECSEASVRWSDMSEELLVRTDLDDELDDEAILESPSVPSSPCGSKKSSRRSTRRRRRREEALKNGGILPAYTRGQAHLAQQADPPHVVTVDDLGFDFGRSGSNDNAVVHGRAAARSLHIQAGAPMEDATRMGGARATYWENMPSSPCKATVGASGVISTSPNMAGSASMSDASARRPAPLDLFGEMQPQQLYVASPSHCPGATAVSSFAQSPHCGGVAASASCDASSRIPAGAMPATHSQALAPCLLVSTSPIASKSDASVRGGNAAWSPAAGSPAADALRSLFHGRSFSSAGGADLAAQLQAAAPETYED